jgi:PAT family beta-lactamase induction signal transducer AmpG
MGKLVADPETHVQHNPPWLFAPLAASSGIGYWGVNGLLIPYLLRQHGVPVDRIAATAAFANIPTFCYFLWSPVVDLGLRRRTWILAMNGAMALCLWLAVIGTSGSLAWIAALMAAGNATGTLASAAAGAVMTTVAPHLRGRASGWGQLGNIGIGALAGGAFIWLADHTALFAVAFLTGACVFLPALFAFRVVETPHPHPDIAQRFHALRRDIVTVVWSWRTLVGMIFFCSPVGAGALGNLISSVGPDYHASGSEVALVSGLGGSILMSLGALAGGYICDRAHRMTAYAVFGMAAGVFGTYLALAPATAFTYGAGYSAYAFSTGLAFAAFTALVLDVLGAGNRAAATGYALMLSFGNLPVAYMTWVDGVGYKHGGVRGLMSADALANGVGGILLLALARHCARRWKSAPEPPLLGDALAAVAAD